MHDEGPPAPHERRPRFPPAPADERSQGAGPGAPASLEPRAPRRGAERRDERPQAPDYHRYKAARTRRDAGDLPGGGADAPQRARRRRFHLTPKRALIGLVGLLIGWVVLAIVLFLVSSHFERISPPSNVASALQPAGPPPLATNNILVLGSDTREKGNKEPGAQTSGPGRSDTIMLIRTGGGHSARLSIPRDTVLEIPGHGLQKINAAHAYGGPRMSIEVIKRFLGIPINHVVEVNFEDFPALIDAMGGVTYTGGCVDSVIAGGTRNGGYTLRLPAGTHHLDGREALIVARTRHNLCAPNQDDLNREEHQQALFQAMQSQLKSVTGFLRLPLIAWNAPPAIISDMSGPTLLALFTSLAVEGGAPTKLLEPTGTITLPDGEEGLTVSTAAKRRQVAEFMSR